MNEMRNAYIISARGIKSKRRLRSPVRIWKDNIKKDLKELGFEFVYWFKPVHHGDQ
jgi:hypothetical protein